MYVCASLRREFELTVIDIELVNKDRSDFAVKIFAVSVVTVVIYTYTVLGKYKLSITSLYYD